MNEVAEAATRCWWDEQHPGWMILTLGNRHFETLEQIVQVGCFPVLSILRHARLQLCREDEKDND